MKMLFRKDLLISHIRNMRYFHFNYDYLNYGLEIGQNRIILVFHYFFREIFIYLVISLYTCSIKISEYCPDGVAQQLNTNP